MCLVALLVLYFFLITVDVKEKCNPKAHELASCDNGNERPVSIKGKE
jgi:hypothetical protein